MLGDAIVTAFLIHLCAGASETLNVWESVLARVRIVDVYARDDSVYSVLYVLYCIV